MKDAHFSCFLCSSDANFYASYEKLENHFQMSHHLCQHESCIEHKFVVFATSDELQLHDLEVHYNKKKWATVPIEFHVRGSAVNPGLPAAINPSDIASLATMFPKLRYNQLRHALRKANGDVSTAAENILQDNPQEEEKTAPMKINISKPVKSVVVDFSGLQAVAPVKSEPEQPLSFQWVNMPSGLFSILIFSRLRKLEELVAVSKTCTTLYREASDPSLWKKFGKNLYNPKLLEKHVHLFKNWKHLIISLLSRKRKCKVCQNFVCDFRASRLCNTTKKDLTRFHELASYSVVEPLVLYCSKPSESFKRLREHLQKIHIDTRVDTSHLKGVRQQLMLTDPNTGITLSSYEDIKSYLSLMYQNN